MRVTVIPMVYYKEIEEEFAMPITEFHFFQLAEENHGYAWLDTDDYAIPTLEDGIAEERELAVKFGWEVDESAMRRIKNDIMLIVMLRKMGYTEGVLIDCQR